MQLSIHQVLRDKYLVAKKQESYGNSSSSIIFEEMHLPSDCPFLVREASLESAHCWSGLVAVAVPPPEFRLSLEALPACNLLAPP